MARTCGDCGSEVAAQDAFCGQCGRPVNGDSPAPAAPQPRGGDEPVPQAGPSWPQTPAFGQVSARPSGPSGQAAAQARIRTGPGGQTHADADGDAAGTARESLAYGTADQARGVTEIEMVGRGNFDPLYNKWYSQQVLRQAGIFVGLWALIVPVSALFFLLIGLGGGASGVAGALSAWVKFSTLLSIVLAVLFWLIPVPALLSQRSRLITNAADAAQLVFQHVAAAFARHQTPLDMLQEKTMHPPGEGRRDYLELRRGHFAGYISCFAHGRDLYVGWTYWIRLSPLRWMLMRIGRRFQEYSGRGSDIYQTLRFESARATVAALQSAVLEGTASATAELDGQSPQLADPVGVTGLDID